MHGFQQPENHQRMHGNVQPQVSSGGEVSILKGPDYALAYGGATGGEAVELKPPSGEAWPTR